ncbi:peroxidase-like [Panonychus citri]|uniref:peroxidase-like n=1 Tax=Panonychus citri TaxID=50023 RepID=UPI0023073173|nr:peroxidase-like [Panonychus citri]
MISKKSLDILTLQFTISLIVSLLPFVLSTITNIDHHQLKTINIDSKLSTVNQQQCNEHGLTPNGTKCNPEIGLKDPLDVAAAEPRWSTDYMAKVEDDYMGSPQFNDYLDHCHGRYGDASSVSFQDIRQSIRKAIPTLLAYKAADEEIIDTIDMAKFASRFVAQLAHESKLSTLITNQLVKEYCLDKMETAVKLPKVSLRSGLSRSLRETYLPTSCSPRKDAADLNCDPKSRYASYDGTCNNLDHPTVGMSYSCHRRLLPADYADGVEKLRASVTGEPLPNARLISNVITPDVPATELKLSQMNMQWGQFVVHDLVRTPLVLGNAPLCCPPKPSNHPECETIFPFPEGDSLTKRWNQTCQRNVRSTTCPSCKLGPREQLNAASHSLDLSNVYGYTYADALKGRTLEKGQLKSVYDAKGGEILPSADGFYDPLTLQVCNVPPRFPEFKCFASGDGNRASQHPALMATQTLILRRHNQHAAALAKVNPQWSDETVYWETRRLLTAEYNHITYSEYLPSLFDHKFLSYFSLLPLENGFSKYEPETDVRSISEWATAAGRFGHSQVNDVYYVKNEDETFTFRMKDVFFEMSLIHLGQTEGIVRGLITEPAFEVDPYFVTDVKDWMYQHPNRSGGLDLVGLNVMRGRDHGIPGYIHFVEYCFGQKIKSWTDLYEYIPKNQVNKLQSIYKDLEDLELFVGGISEKRMKGSAMGPTFACINGMQFYHSKFGDRFWYEHGNEAGSFTIDQLNNIRRTTTLARLICKTTKYSHIQVNVFEMPSKSNVDIDCDELPEIDYNLWREDYPSSERYTGF